ncbi:MAG: hypothetical protein LBV39_06240 [Bacteroidales bacterium]|jgi:PKD repeat protein|nr:hypothetical protein [Bacteroidales bacterium]
MNQLKKSKIRLPIILLLALWACGDKEPAPVSVAPSAVIQVEGDVNLPVGGSVTLTATVENAIHPVYSWTVNGQVISNSLTYRFTGDQVGDFFINFRVDADNGNDEKQIKLTVANKVPPALSAPSACIVYAGTDRLLTVEAKNAANAAYEWRLNNELVSTDNTYTFRQTAAGIYTLNVKLTTAGGSDQKTITVTVVTAVAELYFDDGRYRTATNVAQRRKMTVPLGKSLVLTPVICHIEHPATFQWLVDGVSQSSTTEFLTFTPPAMGTYLISVTEQTTSATAEVEVECTAAEGTYLREKTDANKASAAIAMEYIPAPGQFINYPTGTTPEQGVQDLQAWLDDGSTYFHAGAYGGYFIAGFDHSVRNVEGKADLQIRGNPIPSWCEPGVVWVMQDDNGNGLPDDTWYELRGSETGKSETKQRYAVTYFKPANANADVLWADNRGQTGSIDRLIYHQQPYYYPMFVEGDQYTLTGTGLASATSLNGTTEVSPCFSWGYVDNISSGNPDRADGALFWIEDAVQADGTAANLQYIDFVKVQTAATGKAVASGDVSTEAYPPVDLNF